jgi:hypothetical protein
MTKKSAFPKLQSLSDPLFAAIPDEVLRACIVGATARILATFVKGSDTSTGDDYVEGAD